MRSYIYKKTEFDPLARTHYCLYTVGFYDIDGGWQPESDHDTAELAAERTAWLNGVNQITKLTAAAPDLLEVLTELFNLLEENEPQWYLKSHYNHAIKAIKKATL